MTAGVMPTARPTARIESDRVPNGDVGPAAARSPGELSYSGGGPSWAQDEVQLARVQSEGVGPVQSGLPRLR